MIQQGINVPMDGEGRMKLFKRNPCAECVYYVKENNTCQSKKVATSGYGYVSFFDRLFCEPCKPKEDGKNFGSH